MRANPARQPRGIRSGGQFAVEPRAEAGISLAPEIIPGLIDLTAEAQQVLQACRAAGGRPLIVGGSVRDALLSRETGGTVAIKDVDIEVHGVDGAAELKKQLGRVGWVQEQGASFGVLAVKVGDQDFDVSLPRRDSKTGDGHKGFKVEFDPDITMEEAFSRRDFTINAMGWDSATGELIDPFNGRADLKGRILRHTDSRTFADDPLRVLRGVQFSGRFGLAIDPETAELSRSIAGHFGQLPKSRVWGQFAILATKGTDISRALEVLHETGWDEHFPTLAAVRDVPQSPVWHPEGPVHVHLGLAADSAAAAAVRDGLGEEDRTVAVLAAMLHDLGKAKYTVFEDDGRISSHGHAEGGVEPVADFLDRIGAPGDIREKVLPIVREHMCHTGSGAKPSATAVRRLIRRLAGDNGKGPTIRDWARVVDADLTGRGAGNRAPIGTRWVELADSIGWGSSPSKAILRGPHLEAAGMAEKIEYSWVIKASLEAQDDGVFEDEAGAIAWMLANKDRVVAVRRPVWEAEMALKRQRLEEVRAAKREEARAAKAARAAG